MMLIIMLIGLLNGNNPWKFSPIVLFVQRRKEISNAKAPGSRLIRWKTFVIFRN